MHSNVEARVLDNLNVGTHDIFLEDLTLYTSNKYVTNR